MNKQRPTTGMKRRSLLRRIGLGGLVAAAGTMLFRTSARGAEGALAPRMAGFFNATSDWMNWLYLMNENAIDQEVSISLYNLPGELVIEDTVLLSAQQTLIIALETLPGVKGKQGMTVIVPQAGMRLAATILYRRASQPDHTAAMVPCSPTILG